MLSCLWDGVYKRTFAASAKSSPCGNSGFPLLLSEWLFTKCLTPYDTKSVICLNLAHGEVKESLTCTFRASCCSARLSWPQMSAFANSLSRTGKKKGGGGGNEGDFSHWSGQAV